jgi:hypothetical protein
MPEPDLRRGAGTIIARPFLAAHQQRHRRADLDAFPVPLGRKYTGIGLAVRRDLAGFVLVAVQAVDPDPVCSAKCGVKATGSSSGTL